ncbi:MAG: hypothetical protein JWP00_3809 [Chloroflexi bacterium]|jgi:hypothetical protein|nr:hypothetical protein [Chloroflexota bacterium]
MASPKIFTLEEATSLLPVVREIVREIQAHKHRADEAREAYEQFDEAHARGNGYDMKREIMASQIMDQMKAVQAGFVQLQEIGCELKDIEMGLIDFPSIRNGQLINLCWMIDEESIGYWHSLDSGFASRKPL